MEGAVRQSISVKHMYVCQISLEGCQICADQDHNIHTFLKWGHERIVK